MIERLIGERSEVSNLFLHWWDYTAESVIVQKWEENAPQRSYIKII